MKQVLVAHPLGVRLYEMEDHEFDRFDYLLQLSDPAERGAWATRFLAEREPTQIFPPGARGADAWSEIEADRVIGGNAFTAKWGQIEGGRTPPENS